MIFDRTTRVTINLVTKRFRGPPKYYKSWPNDWVPFHWSRPEKTPGYYNSGDLVPIEEPSKEDIHPKFRNANELKALDVDHPLRMIFSLDHVKKSQQSKIFAQGLIDQLGVIHHVEFSNSLEAKIINLTYSIKSLQARIRREGGGTNWNTYERTIVNGLIYRRYRYLCDLKEIHKERYERIIKSLKIEPKENLINVPNEFPFRKVQMRRLAINYSSDLKEKKVADYLESLEREKNEFEKYKKETLEWIKEKEAQIGMNV